MVDYLYDACGGEYELAGVNPNPRKHYSGRDIWFRTGDHVHGDAQDFLGLSDTNKYRVHGFGPWDPCAECEHLFFELGLGARKDDLNPVGHIQAKLRIGTVRFDHPGVGYLMPAGLALAGVVYFPIEFTPAGLALAGAGVDVVAEVEKKQGGLEFAGLLNNGIAFGEPIAAGLELAGAVAGVVEVVEVDGGGLELAGVVAGVVEEPEFVAAGLELAGIVHATPIEEYSLAGLNLGGDTDDVDGVEFELEAAGLELAGVGTDVDLVVEIGEAGLSFGGDPLDVDLVAEHLEPGLEFAGVVSDTEISAPTPGTGCDGAADFPVGSSFAFDLTGMTHHWFKFVPTTGTQYHVKVTTNSGSNPHIDIWRGSNCLSRTLEAAYNASSCAAFTMGSSTPFIWVEIYFSFGGTCNYTLEIATGACP